MADPMTPETRPCASCGEPAPAPAAGRPQCRACRRSAQNRASSERAARERPPAPERARGSVLTTEVQYTPEEWEFAAAMDRYKRSQGRPFPTWSEVLAVLVSLGYRKPPAPGGDRHV